MKRLSLFLLPALAAVLALGGCGDDPVSPGSAPADVETQALRQAMDDTPELAEGATYEQPAEETLPGAFAAEGGLASEAALRPLHFFRVIRERQRDVQVRTERDSLFETAHVRVEERLAGSFVIVRADSTDSGLVRRLVPKPLRDRGLMHAVFRRRLDDDPAALRHRGWRLAAVSGRQLASPGHTARILSVRLQTGSGLDLEVSDPLALMRVPRGIPRVLAGEPVRVTVRVSDPTDLVFLLAGFGRLPLRPESEGVFVGGFRAPDEPRPFRLGVNALDRGTLLDDQAPYDSDFWGLPVHSAPPELAAQ